MAIRTNVLDEPNDKLLATLLHIAGLAPLYRWQDQRKTMELVSATLYLDAALMPDITDDQKTAAIQWAAGKCSLKPEQVTIAAMPGGGSIEYTGHLQPFAIPASPDDPHRLRQVRPLAGDDDER
jgi:hypothetical protein